MADRTDNFNRADTAAGTFGTPSDAGSDWIHPTNDWGISSNKGYNPGGAGGVATVLESSIADCDIQFTLSTVGGRTGLVARFTDDSNYILFDLNVGSTEVNIFKKVAGSFTLIAGPTSSITFANGDVWKFTVNGSALTGYQNGVSKISGSDSFNSTATQHGIRSSSTTDRYDDFSITALGGGAAGQPAAKRMGGVMFAHGLVGGFGPGRAW